jgi:hypothetical protein
MCELAMARFDWCVEMGSKVTRVGSKSAIKPILICLKTQSAIALLSAMLGTDKIG